MNSNYTTNKQSSEELKQQIFQDIHNVERDLDEIQGRVTPGQYIDKAIFKRKGMSFTDVFERLKTNPIGTSLITLGVLCLMEDENHVSYETKIKNKTRAMADKAVNAAHSAQDVVHSAQDKIHTAKDKLQNVQHQVQEKFHSSGRRADAVGFEDVGLGEGMDVEGLKSRVSSNIEETKENVASKIQHTKENVSAKFHEAKDTVSAKLHETRGKVSDEMQYASEKVREKTHDTIEYAKNLDPLTYIALGAGLGTITGAALPVSEKEKNLVDSKLEQNLHNFANELQDAINESANILKNEFIGGFTQINMRIFS